MEQLARTPSQIGTILHRHRRLPDLTQTQPGEKTHMRHTAVSDLNSRKKDIRLEKIGPEVNDLFGILTTEPNVEASAIIRR